MTRLGVECRAHREDPTRRQIQQLGHERRGAEVHSHAQALAGSKGEGRVVRQDGGIPLPELDSQIAFDDALAGESPAVCQFFG